MGKKKLTSVQQQSGFCAELMKRLNDTIQKAKVSYGTIEYHTQMENDVLRLRRELNELRHMLQQYGYEE